MTQQQSLSLRNSSPTLLDAANASASSPSATTTNEAKVPIAHIYPVDTDVSELSKTYSVVKRIYYIRHAEGSHNVNKEYRDITNHDARLTEKGKRQCRDLASRICSGEDPVLSQMLETVELVISSPLTRCLETTLLTLEPVLAANPATPVLAHDGIRETVNFNCDRRRTLTELASEFSHVDFSHVPDHHDKIWDEYEETLGSDTAYPDHRESAMVHSVAERARLFLHDFLASRREEHIAICSHRAFSRVLWNYGIGQATNLEQVLDTRQSKDDVPLVEYKGDDAFAATMQADYDNCELRSMLLAFQ